MKKTNSKGVYYFRGMFNISLSGLLDQIIQEYGNQLEIIEYESILHVYQNKIKKIAILDFICFNDIFVYSKEGVNQTIENILKGTKSNVKNKRIAAWVDDIKSHLGEQKGTRWDFDKISKLAEKENAK